jgi:tRNA (Thr-GGU) A37 N-methylase
MLMKSRGNEGERHKCVRCGEVREDEELLLVDDERICTKCMYPSSEPFRIYPIGYVRNDLQRNPRTFGVLGRDEVSRVELFPSQKPFMYKLEEEKSLTIIYYLHNCGPVKSRFRRGLDGKEVGVFASRTPDRLSRIAVQDIRLVDIRGTTLHVKGLDAIDGSPVLDIKLRKSSLD